MKIQTTIKEMGEEDLVYLCSLLEGAPQMHLTMDEKIYNKYKEEGDCIEDVWARALLAGEKIQFVDEDDCIEGIDDANEPAEGVIVRANKELRSWLSRIIPIENGTFEVDEATQRKIETGKLKVGEEQEVNGKKCIPLWKEWYQTTVCYEIGLQEILNGLSKPEANDDLQDFINENGDMWTAYNLWQIIAFGEVIYG